MTTLASLTSLRSQRAGRLRAHLERLASGAAWVSAPWLRQAGHTPDTVYVEPDVLAWNQAKPSGTADEELRAAIARVGDGRTRVCWSALSIDVHRAVILGRPGEGKTTLLQRTCQRIAESSLTLLDGRKPLEEIPIPLWLRAEHIVRAGSVMAALGIDSLEASPSFALSQEERRLALASPSTWLFVDALDECPDDMRGAAMVAALATLGTVRARVLLSVRTYAWREDDLPFVTATQLARRDRSRPYPGIEHDRRSQFDQSRSEDTLDVYELAPLTREQRIEMVTRWCATHPDRREQLTRLLDEVPWRELSSNALLLTLLCLTVTSDHSRAISRETRRVELYAWLVAELLTRRDKANLNPASSAAQERVLALARAAWALWQANPGGPFHYQDWIDQLRVACDARSLPAGVFREIQADVERAGVLVSDGPLRRFFPQTAYEYLAGAGLVQDAALAPDMPTRIARTIVDHAEETPWREVILLAIGHLAVIRGRSDLCSQVIHEALDAAKDSSGATEALLGEALADAGERDPRTSRTTLLTGTARQRMIETLLMSLRDDETVAAPVRARIGAALGWLGDPRFDSNAYWLPVATEEDPLRGFVVIPKGRFWSDTGDYPARIEKEFPPQEVMIERPFLLARWPVTRAQYGCYMHATGERGTNADSFSASPSAPVCWVSAIDAERYCRWLTQRLTRRNGPLALFGQMLAERLKTSRVVVRLPTEAEWEYVAKGGDEGRVFPWGDEFDPSRTNGHASRIGEVSAVGCFPRGAARWPVEELAGNVWEWTSTSAPAEPWREDSLPSEDATGLRVALRVVRGGAYIHASRDLSSTLRDKFLPFFRGPLTGFRLVVSSSV